MSAACRCLHAAEQHTPTARGPGTGKCGLCACDAFQEMTAQEELNGPEWPTQLQVGGRRIARLRAALERIGAGCSRNANLRGGAVGWMSRHEAADEAARALQEDR